MLSLYRVSVKRGLTVVKYKDNLLFCNMGGTLASICGNIVFPPRAHASLSSALSATTALLENNNKNVNNYNTPPLSCRG